MRSARLTPGRLAVVLVAHGSRDPRAAASTEALARAVRRAHPTWEVAATYLDHAGPRPLDVLAALPAGRQVVVVPLLLTAAYHGRVDIPAVLADAAGMPLDVRLADVLGPAARAVPPLLIDALVRRLSASADGFAGADQGLADPASAVDAVAVGESAVGRRAVDRGAVDRGAVDRRAVDQGAVGRRAVVRGAVDRGAIGGGVVDRGAVGGGAVGGGVVDRAAVGGGAVGGGGVGGLDGVVLAAAGTRDAAARETIMWSAEALSARLSLPVAAAYASAASPTAGEAVSALRASGCRRVGVATYFLAPGFLYDVAVRSAREAGAWGVADPLGDAPELVRLVGARVSAAAPSTLAPAA